MIEDIIIIGFGIFLCIGAIFGFKAGSKVSLITGLSSGFIVFFCYFILQNNMILGYKSLATLGIVLSGIFFGRLIKTRKFMPSGMLLLVSLAFFIFMLSRFNEYVGI